MIRYRVINAELLLRIETMKRPIPPFKHLLNLELAKRGWTLSDLARETEIPEISILAARARAVGTLLRTRRRIEVVLGVPIWSTSQDFETRKNLTTALGFDPYFLPKAEIRSMAQAKGIRIPIRCQSRNKIVNLLQKKTSPLNQPKTP